MKKGRKGSFQGCRRTLGRAPLLITIILLLWLSVSGSSFAGSATWNLSPGTGDWDTNANWTPNTGFPNGASDTATFATSNTTGVSISANTTVAGITFNSGASAFTITVNPVESLTIQGTGIANNSSVVQNFA